MFFPHQLNLETTARFGPALPADVRDARRLTHARPAATPAFEPTPATPAQKQGVEYERWVYRHWAELIDVDHEYIFFQQAFRFQLPDEADAQLAIADVIAVDRSKNRITIYEIKRNHCARAWYQLFWLYAPIVRYNWCEPEEVRHVEIVDSYDAAVLLPGPHRLLDHPGAPLDADTLGVLHLPRKPRGTV